MVMTNKKTVQHSVNFNKIKELEGDHFQYYRDLKIKTFRSIHDIDPGKWDSITNSQNIFTSHRFLCSIEDANIENSTFWYLVFYKGNLELGSAVLSSNKVSLDLFMDKKSQALIRKLRKYFPNLLRVKMLFCGLPISIGHNSINISNSSYYEPFIEALNHQMKIIASKYNVHFLSLKEFLEDETIWADELLKFGYLKIESIPYVSIKIRWQDFSQYLNELRYGYRRQINKSLLNAENNVPIIYHYDDTHCSDMKCHKLVLYKASEFSPTKFYKLYHQVIKRAVNKLEELNEEFFKYLLKRMDEDIMILAIEIENDIVGAAIIIKEKKKLTYLLVGIDYNIQEHQLILMNLLYGIFKLAMDYGCDILDLGQTSYWLKQRLGGECTKEYFYLKSNRFLIHHLLNVSKRFLFQKIKISSPRVFKKTN